MVLDREAELPGSPIFATVKFIYRAMSLAPRKLGQFPANGFRETVIP